MTDKLLKSGLENGSRLSDFHISSHLGRGAFSHVFHGKSKHTGQEVAIKVIDKKIAKAHNLVHRIINEIELHSRLEHPNIIELYSFSEDKSSFYIFLEYCNHGNLYSYLNNNKRLSETTVRLLGSQLVDALSYLHSHNIVHRDLKLSNVLLQSTNGTLSLKIGDFGLALLLNEHEGEADTICGTINYLAPEVHSHLPYGKPSDRWSLGCLLYAMLTGKLPFNFSNTNNITQDSFIVSFPSFLSNSAKDLLKKLLIIEPDRRISLSEVLRHPFFIGNSSRTSAAPARPSSRLSCLSTLSPMSTPSVQSFSTKISPKISQKISNDKFLSPLSTSNVRAYSHKARVGTAVVEGPGLAAKLVFDADGSVFSVSGDGRIVTITRPISKSQISTVQYELAELPAKYYNKYNYVYNFVALVAQKTALVEYTSPHAEFVLSAAETFVGKFHNGIELEIREGHVTFLNHDVIQSNLKSQSNQNDWKISHDFSSIISTNPPPHFLSFPIKHILESYVLCKNLAQSAHSDLPISVLHPAVVKGQNSNIQPNISYESPSTSSTLLPSFSFISETPPVQPPPLSTPSLAFPADLFGKVVFQQGLGWAIRLKSDSSVLFMLNDGTILKLSKNGKTVVVSSEGKDSVEYSVLAGSLPSNISAKLSQIAPLLGKINLNSRS
ncbi:hypothetical protein RCL1_002270 [Eukaryota sp. TZLM3-RCL]